MTSKSRTAISEEQLSVVLLKMFKTSQRLPQCRCGCSLESIVAIICSRLQPQQHLVGGGGSGGLRAPAAARGARGGGVDLEIVKMLFGLNSHLK